MGSFLIAIIAYTLFDLRVEHLYIIFIFGFIGNIIDTLLGAFVQAGYQCPNCGLKTERTFHCGQQTKLIKGIPIFNNDMVNFLSGFFTLILGILISG